jgi:hypothetical protein
LSAATHPLVRSLWSAALPTRATSRVFSQGCSVSRPQPCDVSDKFEAAKSHHWRSAFCILDAMLVLVTTTWNTSAADPKRAIARADALILAPQVCCKTSRRNGPNAKPENSPVVRGGSWQKVTYLAFTNNRADCRARSTDFSFFHGIIARFPEFKHVLDCPAGPQRQGLIVAMLRRMRILGSHPYRRRRVSRSARRLSVRHHPYCRSACAERHGALIRQPTSSCRMPAASCVMPRIASPNSRTCARLQA